MKTLEHQIVDLKGIVDTMMGFVNNKSADLDDLYCSFGKIKVFKIEIIHKFIHFCNS